MDQNEENSMLSSQAEVTTHDEFVCGFEPFQSAEIFKSCLVRLVSSLLQEEAIRKKYGGMLPKKPPLISKDHERAYFDSADWALGKVLLYESVSIRLYDVVFIQPNQLGIRYSSNSIYSYSQQQGAPGGKPKGPLEALRPKLQACVNKYSFLLRLLLSFGIFMVSASETGDTGTTIKREIFLVSANRMFLELSSCCQNSKSIVHQKDMPYAFDELVI
ncbi:hypothetical protein COCNU_02G004620 [Cocos nucifera]|uniref:Uncharacterized protein n=1 Tax=Cocos nucifera TaxID=13894 RepID=A0A8K0HYZ1_COCNU|nr:hypothetical protein COCNU_02G004620 [Cocos nucifera]